MIAGSMIKAKLRPKRLNNRGMSSSLRWGGGQRSFLQGRDCKRLRMRRERELPSQHWGQVNISSSARANVLRRDHGTFKEPKGGQNGMERGISLSGDLGGHLKISGFLPKNNKDPHKCQAGDHGDRLMASDWNLKCPPSGGKPYPQDF